MARAIIFWDMPKVPIYFSSPLKCGGKSPFYDSAVIACDSVAVLETASPVVRAIIFWDMPTVPIYFSDPLKCGGKSPFYDSAVVACDRVAVT